MTFPIIGHYPPRTVVIAIVYCLGHFNNVYDNKKHLKNVGPIRHCEPSFYITTHQVSLLSHAATVARRLRIDVHDNDDNDNDNA